MGTNARDKGMPVAVKAVAVVLILILVLIVALLVRSGNKHAGAVRRTVGGGGPPPAQQGRHFLGDALHEIRLDQTRQPHPGRPPPPHVTNPPPKRVIHHGGRAEPKVEKKKPKKAWTQYETWDALYEDEGAHAAYWDDVATVLNELQLDWSGVRKTLAKIVYDNREWAGRINYVNGKLKVVELVPSPHAIGEGPLPKQAEAMVPAEVIQRLENKPGLFLFHTHPGEDGGSATPSAIDMAGAIHIGYTGRYAAEVVVSPYGVFLYTPSADLRRKIWSVENDDPKRHDKARLTTLRQIADLLGAFDGARSWNSPWSLKDYARLARRYGIEYVVFPDDKFIHVDHRQLFTAELGVDHGAHQDYLARIKELEEEASAQEIVAADVKTKGKKGRPCFKRARFAPGV